MPFKVAVVPTISEATPVTTTGNGVAPSSLENHVIGHSRVGDERCHFPSDRDLRNRASRCIGYIKEANFIGITAKLRRPKIHPRGLGKAGSEQSLRSAAGFNPDNLSAVGGDK